MCLQGVQRYPGRISERIFDLSNRSQDRGLEAIEQKFRRWNVPHAVGAQESRHIAIEKPKKTCREYFNYKGYFSLVLLALVDAEYKFLWVNVGASGSSSDAQIFNCSKLKRRIENRTLGHTTT